MKRFKMLEVLKKKHLKCTGCGACANICPSNALTLRPDALGFLKPVLLDNVCKDCGACRNVCPLLGKKRSENREKPICFAASGEDALRKKSSSGGAFSIFAEWILEQHGIVAGAAFDNNLDVFHRFVETSEELEILRKSKYAQSRIGYTYREAETFLKQGRILLFSGCPCQIAGLYSFLGGHYENLYTIDLLCHGVPSVQMLRDSLEELSDPGIQCVDFRDKEFGWECLNLTVRLKDGRIKRLSYNESRYEQGFHSNMTLCDSCYDCSFCAFPRQADLTIGDFWSASQYAPVLADGKGVSAILSNNEHGDYLLRMVKNKFVQICKQPLETLSGNRVERHINAHPMRARFLQLYPEKNFNKAVLYAQQNRHDIGIVGNWSYPNYGSELTYYALYCVLTGMGYSVVMLSWPKDSAWKPYESPQLFQHNPYPQWDIAELPQGRADLRAYNDHCDTFVLGSDQLLNNNLYNYFHKFMQLDWVKGSHRKVAYAASFGADYIWGCDDDHAELAHFLRRFDFVSVRETSGVRIMRDHYGVKADVVLDPVFLLPIEKLEAIGDAPFRMEGPYLLAYLLDADEKMMDVVQQFGDNLHLSVLSMEDAAPADHQIGLSKKNTDLQKLSLETWIAAIKGSQFVITDSFHGMCVAIRFQKPFYALSNEARGAVRFQELLSQLNLTGRLCLSTEELAQKTGKEQIDYDFVVAKLLEASEVSRRWLLSALEQELPPRALTDYDLMMPRIEGLDTSVCNISAQMGRAIAESVKTDTVQWEQLEDHRKRLDGLDSVLKDSQDRQREFEFTDSKQWEQLEDHRKRLDGLDAQASDALRLGHDAATADTEQWKALEDYRLRLNGLDAQIADASRLGLEASAADAEQWKLLEDHRLRLDGLDAKSVENVALVNAAKTELSEHLNQMKELILALEQRNAELQSEVTRLEESSLRFRLKKFFSK